MKAEKTCEQATFHVCLTYLYISGSIYRVKSLLREATPAKAYPFFIFD